MAGEGSDAATRTETRAELKNQILCSPLLFRIFSKQPLHMRARAVDFLSMLQPGEAKLIWNAVRGGRYQTHHVQRVIITSRILPSEIQNGNGHYCVLATNSWDSWLPPIPVFLLPCALAQNVWFVFSALLLLCQQQPSETGHWLGEPVFVQIQRSYHGTPTCKCAAVPSLVQARALTGA